MSGADFLRRLVGHLERSGVPYMLAGSFASTFHGAPRTTHDIDLVVGLTPGGLRQLLRELGAEDYYVSRDAAEDALRRRGQFNVIDLASGWKADLIVRKRRPFSDAEFERRERAEVLGVETWIASAEDTAISKLEWASQGESERQLRDVAGIIEMRGAALDGEYIRHWCSNLGLLDLWERAKALATPKI